MALDLDWHHRHRVKVIVMFKISSTISSLVKVIVIKPSHTVEVEAEIDSGECRRGDRQ
jgi:hypothetical protein